MSDHCCQRQIETDALHARQRRLLLTVLAINVATFLMMVVSAAMSGSSSILSGALDNFGDAVTYALSFAVVGSTRSAKAKVAMFKGALILTAAIAVAAQIVWRLFHLDVPVVETMSIAAVLNLAANVVCLRLLTPHRHSDVNMASVWECSRNDVMEGVAVIAAVFAVWLLESGWPDIVIATFLLILFLRSARRVLQGAFKEMRPAVVHNP